VDGLLALFSIDTSLGLGVSFGVVPYSGTNYSVERTIGSAKDSGSIQGLSNQTGSGGVSSIQLGVSTRVLPELSLGVSANVLFGLTSLTEQVTSKNYSERVQTLRTFDIRGTLVRAGLFFRPNTYMLFCCSLVNLIL
jgi:hypothetical protein